MGRKKENPFTLPIHKICSTDSIRAYFNYVHFVNGYAYATDAHIAVKVSIDSFCNTLSIVKNADYKNLNGYSANIQTYSFLQSCDFITDIKDGVVSFIKGSLTGTILLDKYESVDGRSDDNKTHNQLDKIINAAISSYKDKHEKSDLFGINPKLLNRLHDALFKDIISAGVRVRVTERNKAILIDEPSHFPIKDGKITRIGIIMPVSVPDND